MVKKAYAMMGLVCNFCRKPCGNLAIPRDKIAYDAMVYLMRDLEIHVQCDECLSRDPFFMIADEVDKAK
jgi:hypothetical protein